MPLGFTLPDLIGRDWIIDAVYPVDIDGGRKSGLVGLMQQSVYSH
jgi:hypothetical protein